MLNRARIAVFVSGGGTNLQALLDAQKNGAIPHGEIALVVSSQAGAYALERAKNAGVPAQTVPSSLVQQDFERAIEHLLAAYQIDVILLAGFLSILSESFTKKWPRRILNIHPSLIPSFAARECTASRYMRPRLHAGVKVTGATVHFVNEIPDVGEIVLQKAVEIESGDTAETLQRRVMEQAEWQLLPRARGACLPRDCGEGGTVTMVDFLEFLRNTSYPGRGILVGKDRVYYFIMGRSENSRNRVL